MAPQVRRRRAAAKARRDERLAMAETPAEQLNAAYDYLRAAMRALDHATKPGQPSAADPIRTEVAKQLIAVADQARTQGSPS